MNSNRLLSATIVPIFHFFSAVMCIFFSNELSNKIYYEDYSDSKYFLFMSIGFYSMVVSVLIRSVFVYSKEMYIKFIPILFLCQLLLTIFNFYIIYFYKQLKHYFLQLLSICQF